MEQGFWGAVIAAIITSFAVSWFNLELQSRQHKNALELQQKQWDKEAEWRREDHRYRNGREIAAWDNARIDQKNEREHALLIQLQADLARFSRAARAMFEGRLAAVAFHDDPANAGQSYVHHATTLAFEEEFNAMRVPMMATISHIRDDTLRDASLIVYDLGVTMAVGTLSLWDDPAHWGGNPIFQLVDRQTQVVGMAGRLIRGERIGVDELIPVEHERGAFGRRVKEQQRSQERRALRQAGQRD